jgi:hypothetical protein
VAKRMCPEESQTPEDGVAPASPLPAILEPVTPLPESQEPVSPLPDLQALPEVARANPPAPEPPTAIGLFS